jgi:hypothetical protein
MTATTTTKEKTLASFFIWLTLFSANAFASTIAFISTEEFTGAELGNREHTSAYCASRGLDLFGCSDGATAYLSYYGTGYVPTDFPQNETIYARDGLFVSSNISTLQTTNLFPAFWIGNASDLYGACEDWTTDGCFNGLARLSDGRLRLRGCSMRFPILCICRGGSFIGTPGPTTFAPTSKSPTQSPTSRPSARPTRTPTLAPTLDPTLQPTYVYASHNSLSHASLQSRSRRVRWTLGIWNCDWSGYCVLPVVLAVHRLEYQESHLPSSFFPSFSSPYVLSFFPSHVLSVFLSHLFSFSSPYDSAPIDSAPLVEPHFSNDASSVREARISSRLDIN